MPRADVVVIGAGLAGLTAAARLAESGASVALVAKGHASTHWAAGGIDVAAPDSARTPADGVATLAAVPGHPYGVLGADVVPATAWLQGVLAEAGLPYAGTPETPIRRVPTAIGGTRRVAIVPEAQAAALRPWEPDEVLVVAGPAGFKDFWPAAVADSLSRDAVWHGSDRPARVIGVAVELDGVAGRRNVNALELANRLDDPQRRAADLDRIALAVGRAARGRPGRVALPAIVGLRHHAEAWADARAALPLDPFEVPLVPPSVPGIRLWQALRARIRAGGGRVQVGEQVHRIEIVHGRVVAVELEAATRVHRITTDAVVLATGGIAGGGLIGTVDGRLVEPLLGLPVETPPQDDWLRHEALDPAGHPVESAGIRTDAQLHPLDADGQVLANVFVVGALLAGQRALRERCGDGVAVASGWRAATTILHGPPAAAEAPTPVGASSRSRRTAR
jgi:glycerol-3-phosphate dehydrogenase subunit B